VRETRQKLKARLQSEGNWFSSGLPEPHRGTSSAIEAARIDVPDMVGTVGGHDP